MRANVYVVAEARDHGNRVTCDVYIAAGTYEEALEHYERHKGRPPQTVEHSSPNGHDVWILDADETGRAWIAQYKVDIFEIVE